METIYDKCQEKFDVVRRDFKDKRVIVCLSCTEESGLARRCKHLGVTL